MYSIVRDTQNRTIKQNANCCSEAFTSGPARNGKCTSTAGSELIKYRRAPFDCGGSGGKGSGEKSATEKEMHQKSNFVATAPESGVYASSIETSCGVPNHPNSTSLGNNSQEDVFRNFNERSTSPRVMSTSDYLVSAAGSSQHLSGSTQKDNNESDNNISSCSTLDIGNKVENTSIKALESQLKELSQRLQKSESSRDDYKRKSDEAAEEKERCYRRLEVISAAHESRITEMHCVIAELSKKLRTKQENTIMEENEADGSEISYQEGSIYNSELNLTNPDAECQTDPLDGDYSIGFCDRGEEDTCLEDGDNQKIFNDAVTKTQVEALQEEVLHLRARIALLQSEIANPLHNANDVIEEREAIEIYDGDVEADAANAGVIRCFHQSEASGLNEADCCSYDDHEKFYKTEDNDADGLVKKTERSIPLPNSSVKGVYQQQGMYLAKKPENICITRNNGAINNEYNKKYLVISSTNDNYTAVKNSMPSPKEAAPVSKMAERVKLRRTTDSVMNVTATDLIKSGINSTEIVEHLVSDMMQGNNMMDSFVEASQVDTEFQRLQRRIEQLKMRNTVLSLTLEECKEHCDHLYLLCGKYESNAIALQSAVNCSDRAIEAYDVMLALLESKLAILKEHSEAAEESRKAVVSVARHLLDRLESEKNMSENSLGPWQNTFCIADKPFEPWTHDDDNRLRNHVSKLKGRRSNVQNTIVNLESPFSSFYEKSRMALDNNKELKQEKNIRMDLEMAVIMQELLSLREENIQLKQKRDEAERDRQFAIDKICTLQDALQQLQTQLSVDSDALFNLSAEDRSSYSEADHAALTERQLVEALTRESELKVRIQSLIGSVSASRKTSDEKYEQVQNNIKELQKTNMNLLQSLEQTKRKYQSKIRKLEQKIIEMSIEFGHLSQHQNRSGMFSQENVPETTL